MTDHKKLAEEMVEWMFENSDAEFQSEKEWKDKITEYIRTNLIEIRRKSLQEAVEIIEENMPKSNLLGDHKSYDLMRDMAKTVKNLQGE